MVPTLSTWHGIDVHPWGITAALGFLVAFLVTSWRARRVGVARETLVPLYLLVTLGGLAGARLLHFACSSDAAAFFRDPVIFFDLTRGGFTFLGGLVGGGAAFALYCARRRIPAWKLADVCAPAVMLGLSIGRIGCFFAGCCHGAAIDGARVIQTLLALPGGDVVQVQGFPWISFVYERGAGASSLWGAPLYPSQLWGAAAAALWFCLLSWMWRSWRVFDGQIAASMLLLYGGWRYTAELYRGDASRGVDYLGHFSTSQLVSVGIILAASVLILRAPRGVLPEEPLLRD